MAVPHAFPLRPRDREILEHVARDRLTIHAVLRKRWFVNQSAAAAGKVVRRLCRYGLLRRCRWPGGRSYFVLTVTAAQRLGVSIKRTGTLGSQALPTQLATLVYVHLGTHPRLRMTANELRAQYTWFKRPWCLAPHCLDLSVAESPCLELLRVDLGGSADHVARKCQRDLSRRQTVPEFLELVAQAKFRLAVLTATREKSQAVQQALERHHWPAGLEIRFVVLPQLLTLLGCRRHAS